MSAVTATCGGCGKSYSVAAANLFGKTVKCRKCGATFRVPAREPQRATAATTPAAPSAPPTPARSTKSAKPASTRATTEPREDDDLYPVNAGDDAAEAPRRRAAIAAAPGPPAAPAYPGPAGPTALPLMTPSGRVLPEAAQRMLRGEYVEPEEPSGFKELLTPEAQWVIGARLVGLPVMLVLMALMAPAMQGFALAVTFVIGFGLLLWGYLGVLVVASGEGGYHAPLAFITGVYWFVYAVRRWAETRTHVLRYAAGAVLVFMGLALMAVDGYRASAARRAAAAAAATAASVPVAPVVPDQGMKNIAEQSDARAAAALAGADRAEARAWIATNPRTQDGQPIELDDVRSATEGLYAAGASQVFVVGLESAVNFGLPPTLVVVLPTDPPARQRVFQWQLQRAYEDDEKPELDAGQKYLVVDVNGFGSLLD